MDRIDIATQVCDWQKDGENRLALGFMAEYISGGMADSSFVCIGDDTHLVAHLAALIDKYSDFRGIVMEAVSLAKSVSFADGTSEAPETESAKPTALPEAK